MCGNADAPNTTEANKGTLRPHLGEVRVKICLLELVGDAGWRMFRKRENYIM